MQLFLVAMMELRLAVLRVDVSKETGEVMLFMENGCGFRPVMGWPNVNGFQDFAETLLGICSYISDKDRNDMTDPADKSPGKINDGK